MKYATSVIATAVCALFLSPPIANADSIEEILRDAVIRNGFVPASSTHISANSQLVSIGQSLFESRSISLNADISCQDCHLDEFSSADGIPNAIGIGGQGSGKDRLQSGGAIIPRNTLPLWGVGGPKFEVFFWDGKVDFSSPNQPISQFGDRLPSEDPLEVAVHLPAVEIREMLQEDNFIRASKIESVQSADEVYMEIVDNLARYQPEFLSALADAVSVEQSDITFQHIAAAMSAFIRTKFALRETSFHRFIYANQPLGLDEIAGTRIFYGKGKCAVCHSGPYLSDFNYHAVAIPQRGFGKNGFGVDYGRFNVTHDPGDLYKFRTPPLFNVARTGPYGHSGSTESLEAVIIAHFDPLRIVNLDEMNSLERTEFYKQIAASADDLLSIGYLSDKEVHDLVSFLHTLSFDGASPAGP